MTYSRDLQCLIITSLLSLSETFSSTHELHLENQRKEKARRPSQFQLWKTGGRSDHTGVSCGVWSTLKKKNRQHNIDCVVNRQRDICCKMPVISEVFVCEEKRDIWSLDSGCML